MGPRKHAPPTDGDSSSQHAFAVRQVQVDIPSLRMAAQVWHPARAGCESVLLRLSLEEEPHFAVLSSP
jgi:hypothetical protein